MKMYIKNLKDSEYRIDRIEFANEDCRCEECSDKIKEGDVCNIFKEDAPKGSDVFAFCMSCTKKLSNRQTWYGKFDQTPTAIRSVRN